MALTRIKTDQVLDGTITNDDLASDIALNTSGNITTSGDISATDISAADISAANVTLTGELNGPATFYIDPAPHDPDTDGATNGLVVIRGDLQVDGTTTTVNSTTMDVADLNITLASGAANAAAADGAGITVDGASATITYDGTNDEWDFNKTVSVNTLKASTKIDVDSTVVEAIRADSNTTSVLVINSSATGKIAQIGGTRYLSINDDGTNVVLSAEGGGGVATGLMFTTDPFTSNVNRLFISKDGDVQFYENNGGTPQVGMHWDYADGRLGIGKTDPGKILDLQSTDGLALRFYNSTTFKGGLEVVTTNGQMIGTSVVDDFAIRSQSNMLFATGGNTERVRIDSSGNVVIGSDGGFTRGNLHIGASKSYASPYNYRDDTLLTIENFTSLEPAVLGFVADYTGSNRYGNIIWHPASSQGGSYFTINGDIRDVAHLVVRGDGNVGIGTTGPSYPLEISSTSTVSLAWQRTGTGVTAKKWGFDSDNASTYLINITDNSRPVTFRNDGRVGINDELNPAYELDVAGDIQAQGSFRTEQVRHSIAPTLNLDFANSKQLDPRITFYRDSIATYYDSKGVLRYANVNEPRFDHDPDTGESKGLLIEESRKNTHLSKTNTFEFDYNGGNAYYKLNAGISPDGRYNAAKICEASTNATHAYDAYTVFESSGVGTASFFVKPAGRQGVYLAYYDAFGGQTIASTYFILVGDGEASNSDGTIQKLSNGWYRITRTWPSIANNGPVLRIGLTTGASAGGNYGNASYQGDGQSGILIWGTQQESAAFATSYIPADNRFTSRSSEATYYDETGILRTAPADSPRYGYKYDGRKWVETGLILEGAATNLVLNSTMNSTSNWSPSSATIIIGDYGLNPDNSQGSTMFVRTNAVSGGGKHIRQSFTIQQAQDYTISVYAKLPSGGTNAYDFLYIRLFDATNSASFQAWFNIDTGTIGTVQNAHSANIEDVGNGWYRCSVSGKTTTLSNTGTMLYDLFVAETDGVESNPGDNSSGLLMWGAQLETGFSATSFIYTENASITRSADVSSSTAYTRDNDWAEITDMNWLGAKDELTLYGEAYSVEDGSTNPVVASLCERDSTDNFSEIALLTNSGFIGFSRYNGTVTVDTTAANGKNAITVTADNIKGSRNGGSVITESKAGTFYPYNTRLIIGNDPNGGNELNGTLKKLAYYPEALADAEIQALTENN